MKNLMKMITNNLINNSKKASFFFFDIILATVTSISFTFNFVKNLYNGHNIDNSVKKNNEEINSDSESSLDNKSDISQNGDGNDTPATVLEQSDNTITGDNASLTDSRNKLISTTDQVQNDQIANLQSNLVDTVAQTQHSFSTSGSLELTDSNYRFRAKLLDKLRQDVSSTSEMQFLKLSSFDQTKAFVTYSDNILFAYANGCQKLFHPIITKDPILFITTFQRYQTPFKLIQFYFSDILPKITASVIKMNSYLPLTPRIKLNIDPFKEVFSIFLNTDLTYIWKYSPLCEVSGKEFLVALKSFAATNFDKKFQECTAAYCLKLNVAPLDCIRAKAIEVRKQRQHFTIYDLWQVMKDVMTTLDLTFIQSFVFAPYQFIAFLNLVFFIKTLYNKYIKK